MKSLQLNEITAVQHQELWSATTKPFSSADERNSELKMAKKNNKPHKNTQNFSMSLQFRGNVWEADCLTALVSLSH